MAASGKEMVYNENHRIYVLKSHAKTANRIQRKVWPSKWSHLADHYENLNAELRKWRDSDIVLPHHQCSVKNDFEPFAPDPRYTRPLPIRSNHLFGWKYANSEVHPTYGPKWEKRMASRYFWNQVGWPYGSQQ